MLNHLPALPGSYAIHFVLESPVQIKVGRLGQFDFPEGSYFYLGSARGPGGLRARLLHHARISARPHWHLDWLRPYLRFCRIWYAVELTRREPLPLECAWSQALLALLTAKPVVPGFGSADCRCGCAAHLLAFPSETPISQVEMALLHEASALEAFKIE